MADKTTKDYVREYQKAVNGARYNDQGANVSDYSPPAAAARLVIHSDKTNDKQKQEAINFLDFIGESVS